MNTDVPENLEDGSFALQEFERTGFADQPGDFVAIYQKKVVGSGDNQRVLLRRVSEALGIEPDRLFVVYKGL